MTSVLFWVVAVQWLCLVAQGFLLLREQRLRKQAEEWHLEECENASGLQDENERLQTLCEEQGKGLREAGESLMQTMEQLEDCRKKVLRLEPECNRLMASCEALRTQRDEVIGDSESLRENVVDLESQVKDYRKRIERLEERGKELTSLHRHVQAFIDKLHSECKISPTPF